MVDAYFNSLSKIPAEDLSRAAYNCMDECKFFPRIADVKKHLKKSDNDRYLRDRFTCIKCAKKVRAIVDGLERGLCWECHEGAPEFILGNCPACKKINTELTEIGVCLECGRR